MDKAQSDSERKQPGTGKLVDALLDPDEDFLREECSEEFLLAFGIDPSMLMPEFKEHLEKRARQCQVERGSVPSSISGALRGIREYIKSSNPMNVDPDSHLDLLLGSMLPGGRLDGTVVHALRKEGDDPLCDEDQKLLDELQAELEEDHQEPKK